MRRGQGSLEHSACWGEPNFRIFAYPNHFGRFCTRVFGFSRFSPAKSHVQASPKRRPKQCSRKLVPETHNTEHAGICTSMQTASHGFLMLRTRFVEDPRQFWIQLTGDWTLEQRPQRKACSCSPGMQCRSLSCLRARQLGAHPCSTCQSAGSVHTNGPLLQPSSSTKQISHVSQLPHDKCNTTTYLLG